MTEHIPSYRRPSRRTLPKFRSASQRAAGAGAFTQGAATYRDARPGYPAEVVELLAEAERIVDVGAGTGKLTEALMRPDRQVFALDPSMDMLCELRERIQVPVWQATAEATGLASASVDGIACAQTWHWLDTEAASVEFARIIRPTGTLLLVWNTIDVTDPWVLRLTRIMHAGDVLREGFVPKVHAGWRLEHTWRSRWVDTMTTEDIFALTATRSYWLRSNDSTRAKVRENLRWYLFEYSGLTPSDKVSLPYRCDAFTYRR